MQHDILVLGSTGTVGKEVVNKLQNKQRSYRAAVRKIENEQANQVVLDYMDPNSFAPALEGVKGIFMITPGFVSGIENQFKQLIQVAETAGVEHIVYSSVIGADGNPTGTHRQIELALENSSIAHTILRPNFYMQNFITYEGENTKQGTIFLPTDDGKTSYLDVRDIANAFDAVIFDETHKGKTYTLTGNEALDNQQIAHIFEGSTGKTFNNVNPSEQDYETTLGNYGVPSSVIEASKVLYSYIRNGYVAAVSSDFEQITGQKPISFQHFAQEYVN